MGDFKVFAEYAKRYDEWYDNERNYDRYADFVVQK
jgi:hypothetical protein